MEEGRPYWKVRLIAVLLTVGLSIFISMIPLTFGPQIGGWIADQVGLGNIFQTAWNLVRWPVIVGLLIVATALVYYVAPDVEQEWQWITPGSVVAVIGWLVASLGFSYYDNNFGAHNATYGSIGAVRASAARQRLRAGMRHLHINPVQTSNGVPCSRSRRHSTGHGSQFER